MENLEMVNKLAELQEYKRMREEIDATIESLQDSIKAALGDTENAVFGPYKVSYKPQEQTRLDSTALKKELPEVAARYSKTITIRPLRVS